MKAATLKELKDELRERSPGELLELCLRLGRFKKENKELLTYLLFLADDEAGYIEEVKAEIDGQFSEMNKTTYYFIKKSVRKILRTTKKYIRYSKKKETEVELLLHFCASLKNLRPSMLRNTALHNIYLRQITAVKKVIATLHEDLQFDYSEELAELTGSDPIDR